ncbi:hypothetical protein, partial [Streptomyces sp. NPDC088258]|uniref:hypothetical protein n=1 Tax=Streptomyces sp. NPDC088258 TaxID=3365849 RepID=UPI00381F8C1E
MEIEFPAELLRFDYQTSQPVKRLEWLLIKSGPSKDKRPIQRPSEFLRQNTPSESGRVGTAGKGKRESEELESEPRSDGESDTKESDRVGNARRKQNKE